MSIIETRLSAWMEAGLSVVPMRMTDIQQLRSGVEYRNARWAKARRRFTIRGAKFPRDVRDKWMDLWHACEGCVYGFLLRDPSDYKATNESQGVAPSGSVPIQIRKNYSYGTGLTARTHVRYIRYIEEGTLTVYENGVAKAGTFSEGYFTPTSAWNAGAEVTATFRFLVPVRFATDEPEWTVVIDGLCEINADFIEVLDE